MLKDGKILDFWTSFNKLFDTISALSNAKVINLILINSFGQPKQFLFQSFVLKSIFDRDLNIFRFHRQIRVISQTSKISFEKLFLEIN